MGMPAARQGDKVMGIDTHLIQPPGTSPPVPVPLPFSGTITGGCSQNVQINARPAAILGCEAQNIPPHAPAGGTFVNPPTNKGQVIMGSSTVLINGKPAVRAGDTALTCNDPVPAPVGKVVVAGGTVLIG